MKVQDNITRCTNCNRNFIMEEFGSHRCKQLVMTVFDTDGNRWGSYDKIRFFPLPPFAKLSDDSIQSNNHETTDDKYTEPVRRYCSVLVRTLAIISLFSFVR